MSFLSPLEIARLGLPRPELLSKLTQLMDAFEKKTGRKTYIGDHGGVRTFAQQAATYADSLKSGYRASPPGESHHEYGAAFDLIIEGTGDDAATDKANPLYRTLADLGESLGLDAGFYFHSGRPDPYHFQLRETLAEVRERWEKLTKERLRRGAIGVGVALLIAAAVS